MNAPAPELSALCDTEAGAAQSSAPNSDAGGSDASDHAGAPLSELAGSSSGAASEVRDTSQAVEKTTAWSEEELTGGREATDYVPPSPEAPKLPEWCASFGPGELFNANGWECKTLHVGCEEGNWLVLMQPQRRLGEFVPKSRAMKRAEHKQLVRKVGKKKAKAIVKERKATRDADTAEATQG